MELGQRDYDGRDSPAVFEPGFGGSGWGWWGIGSTPRGTVNPPSRAGSDKLQVGACDSAVTAVVALLVLYSD